jgi:hypothetical protein
MRSWFGGDAGQGYGHGGEGGAGTGGGIFAEGPLTVTSSRIAANRAAGGEGGADNYRGSRGRRGGTANAGGIATSGSKRRSTHPSSMPMSSRADPVRMPATPTVAGSAAIAERRRSTSRLAGIFGAAVLLRAFGPTEYAEIVDLVRRRVLRRHDRARWERSPVPAEQRLSRTEVRG